MTTERTDVSGEVLSATIHAPVALRHVGWVNAQGELYGRSMDVVMAATIGARKLYVIENLADL